MTMRGGSRGKYVSEEERLKLLNLLPRQLEHDVSKLAEEFGVSSEEILHIARSLSEHGYQIRCNREKNTIFLMGEGENGSIKYPDIKDVLDHFKIGFISETRVGSKQEQIRLLKGLYEWFATIGVAFVVLLGNVVVGKPDSGSSRTPIRQDVFLFGAEEQRDFIVEHFPIVGKKIKTYIIAGRRDLSWRGKKAYSIIQDICSRRPDLVYWGDQTRMFEVRGIKIIVKNPYDDNGPHGKTYGVQQIADSLDDPHPDVLVVAGMHRYSLIPDYWNDGFGYVCMVPSMHSQMMRQSNKPAPVRPDIGAAILDIDFNKLDSYGNPKVLYTGYNLNPYADYSQSEHFEPYPVYDSSNLSSEESRVLRLVHSASEFGVTVGEISRRIVKMSSKKASDIVEKLIISGHPLTILADRKTVVVAKKIRKNFPAIKFNIAREVKVGVVSDTHLTSTHQQVKLLERSYEVFSENGVEVVLHGGDWSEGAPSAGYRGHMKDVAGTNINKLRDYVVDRYPRLTVMRKDGSVEEGKTVGIAGNHDDWIQAAGGLDFVQAIADKRNDIEYLGSEYGSVVIGGVYYYLLHPRGGSGDTLSRKLEMHIRRARNRASKGKGNPRVFILGNWHQAIAFFDRDVLGFLAPCMKSEDDFHATLGLVPKIGFWIINLGLDEKNNIVSFTPEYFGFREDELDSADYTDFHKWEIEQAEKRGAGE